MALRPPPVTAVASTIHHHRRASALALALAMTLALALAACGGRGAPGPAADGAAPNLAPAPGDQASVPDADAAPLAPSDLPTVDPAAAATHDASAAATFAVADADPALDAFAETVAAALEQGDVEALTPLVADTFALGYDGSEWQILDRAGAASALRTSHLPAGTELDVTRDQGAVRQALAGRVDVDALFGPQGGPSRTLLATGWDGDPGRQGVVFLAPDPREPSTYLWTALLIVR